MTLEVITARCATIAFAGRARFVSLVLASSTLIFVALVLFIALAITGR